MREAVLPIFPALMQGKMTHLLGEATTPILCSSGLEGYLLLAHLLLGHLLWGAWCSEGDRTALRGTWKAGGALVGVYAGRINSRPYSNSTIKGCLHCMQLQQLSEIISEGTLSSGICPGRMDVGRSHSWPYCNSTVEGLAASPAVKAAAYARGDLMRCIGAGGGVCGQEP